MSGMPFTERLLQPRPAAAAPDRSGATLLLTLGILTVISILTVTFLLSARLQKQATVISRNRQAAEHALPVALATAMRQIEESLSYPNFTDEEMRFASGASQRFQRLAPVGRWFSERYALSNDVNPEIRFEYGPVLTSPAAADAPTVNLLTAEVLALVPPALTNGLPLDARDSRPLRSGWIPSDMLESLFSGSALSSDLRLENKPARIAFAIFDCSGAIDANIFPGAPTAQKPQRRYFAQTDVTRDIISDGDSEGGSGGNARINDYLLTNAIPLTAETEPFFHTSYDPGPDTYRYHAGEEILGTDEFTVDPPVNLANLRLDLNNLTPVNSIVRLLERPDSNHLRPYNKFDINSITNILRHYQADSAKLWQNDSDFIREWLMPVWGITELCRIKDKEDQSPVFDDSRRIAWSIANFIDSDRIPEVSHFINYEMPTRANFAVEDVPLISKISLFKVIGPNDRPDNSEIAPRFGPNGENLDYSYYFSDPGRHSHLSNHYAVAVELWYPFAPNSPYGNRHADNPMIDPACYIGIYTNEADISTTTNRFPTSIELGDYFNTNIVMKVLFQTWAREYENEVGWEYLDGNPIWQEIRNFGDYWFTPAMINNPLWRETTEQGETWYSVVLTNSPIYGLFYPETFDVISTNAAGVVSTNAYTYITQTNQWLNIAYPGMTNEFIYGQYMNDTNYMVMYWENNVNGTITNSLLGGIIDENGNILTLEYTNNIALSIIFGTAPDENYLISEDAETGILSTNLIAALILSPDIEPALFSVYTNIFNRYSVAQVTPLSMPPEFEQALNEIFLMLPTNSISAMYDYMMLTTEDLIERDRWNELFDYISNSPGIRNTLIPLIIEPSLGNLSVNDKYWLDPFSDFFDPATTKEEIDPENVSGYFWTIFPKQTVSFREVIELIPVDAPPDSELREVITNCYALGEFMPENSNPNTIWLRPVTTVVGKDIMAQSSSEDTERPFTDRIVDEAVMLAKDNDYNNDTVRGWTSVTNIYVADPRDNAYAHRWKGFHERWDDITSEADFTARTKIHEGVKELPFIHFNAPLQTIGDIGHIYTAYRPMETDEEIIIAGAEPGNTLAFSTRSGAALLDFFTVNAKNNPIRGLVQANTTLKPSLDIMFNDIMVGWTNAWSSGSEIYQRIPVDNRWSELWRETLTKMPFNTGWRCFEDMLPNLATNTMHQTVNVSGIQNPVTKHNYTEDVLRGIIDKVSFRQNVFVIILAAQVVAPGTELSRYPNVLSEQRAAVTVIRDAYSGNWTVSDWRKLSQ